MRDKSLKTTSALQSKTITLRYGFCSYLVPFHSTSVYLNLINVYCMNRKKSEYRFPLFPVLCFQLSIVPFSICSWRFESSGFGRDQMFCFWTKLTIDGSYLLILTDTGDKIHHFGWRLHPQKVLYHRFIHFSKCFFIFILFCAIDRKCCFWDVRGKYNFVFAR